MEGVENEQDDDIYGSIITAEALPAVSRSPAKKPSDAPKPATATRDKSEESCLVIYRLHWWTSDADLRTFLAVRGAHLSLLLRWIRFAENKRNGQSTGVAALCFVSKAHGQAAKELFEAFGATEGFFDSNAVPTKAAVSAVSAESSSETTTRGSLGKTTADGNSKTAIVCRLATEDAANEELRKHSIVAPTVAAWGGRHQQQVPPPVFFPPPLPFLMPGFPEKSTSGRRDQDRHEQRDRARHHSRERSRDRSRREGGRDRPDGHGRRSNESVSASSKRDADKHESGRHSSSRRDRSRERRDRSPRRSRH